MASWSVEDYTISPYSLQAAPISVAPQVAPQAAAANDASQRRGGRQKRSSILCQVEECGIELINQKTYYKRYRICLAHCNMRCMVIGGRRQRFCQQCGRFQDIQEFDGTRKSCRRKLERHNQRRRADGNKGCAWQTDSESDEEDAGVDNDEELKAVAKIKRARSARAAAATASMCAADTSPASFNKGGHSGTSSCSSLNHHNTTEKGGVRAAAQMCSYIQQLPQFMQNGFFGVAAGGWAAPTAMEAEPVPQDCDLARKWSEDESVTLADAGNDRGSDIATGAPVGTALCDMLDVPLMDLADPKFCDPIALTTHEDLLLLPEDPSDSLIVNNKARHLAQERANNSMHDAPRELSEDITWMELASFVDDTPQQMHQFSAVLPAPTSRPVMLPSPWDMPAPHEPPAPASAYAAAASMVTMHGAPMVGYASEDRLLRLSLKVFNCTPDLLLPVVRLELESMLHATPFLIEGSVRPGCVYVTVQARVPAGKGADKNSLAAAVEAMLCRGRFSDAMMQSMMVQLGEELVVVRQARVVAALDVKSSAGSLPAVTAVHPIAVATCVNTQTRAQLLVTGTGLDDERALLLCRQAGRNLVVELPEEVPQQEGAYVSVLGLRPGCAEIEMQAGSVLGAACPLLVLPDAAAVAEVRSLESDKTGRLSAGIGSVQNFLRDVGMVVQYLERGAAAAEGLALPTYTPELLATVESKAARLAAAAIARGWPALAALLLPAATATGRSAGEAAAEMDAACPGGVTLLHLAVGTGRRDVVRVLTSWAASLRHLAWAVDAKGAGGVTPLHVAAVLPTQQREGMRRELCTAFPTANKLWFLVSADDGLTPEALADLAGGAKGSAVQGSAECSGAAALQTKMPAGNVGVKSGSSACAGGSEADRARLSRQEVKDFLIDQHIISMVKEVHGLWTSDPAVAVDQQHGGTSSANVAETDMQATPVPRLSLVNVARSTLAVGVAILAVGMKMW